MSKISNKYKVVFVAILIASLGLGATAAYAAITWGGEQDTQRAYRAIDSLVAKADKGDQSAQTVIDLRNQLIQKQTEIDQKSNEVSQKDSQYQQQMNDLRTQKQTEIDQKNNELSQKDSQYQQQMNDLRAQKQTEIDNLQRQIQEKSNETNVKVAEKQGEIDSLNQQLAQARQDMKALADYADQKAS